MYEKEWKMVYREQLSVEVKIILTLVVNYVLIVNAICCLSSLIV